MFVYYGVIIVEEFSFKFRGIFGINGLLDVVFIYFLCKLEN